MVNFNEIANETIGGSPILKGREKIKTDDLIAAYPQGITVTEFDLIVKSDGTAYPVCAFAENEKAYFNGGALMGKIVGAWVKHYDGDIEKCSNELKAAGGVKFKVEKKQTKTGKTITVFTPEQ